MKDIYMIEGEKEAGHMSISLDGGADRITLLLSVYHIPPPEYKTRYLSVSALPYASLMPICGIFAICIIFVCLLPRPSPISECSLFAFVATTGSYFHLFIYARDLSTRPTRDDDLKSDDNGGEIEDG